MANINETNNVITVRETKNTVSVQESPITVRVIEHGTPVYAVELPPGADLFKEADSGEYWYAEEKIGVKGLGEYGVFGYRPLFIFDNDTQRLQITGSTVIQSDNTDDPFVVLADDNSEVFKITQDEIPVFKTHTTIKTPVEGGLLFYGGDLFFGA